MLEVRVRDRDQRVDPFRACLADADQNSGGERNPRPAGRVQRGEPARRGLVRRAEVRAARFVQPIGKGLDHHPLRRADGAQADQLRLGEGARVGVGEETGLVEHPLRAPRRDSRPCSRTSVRATSRPPASSASSGASPSVNSASKQPSAAPRDASSSTCSSREVRRVETGRRLGERAVAAAVAAQHRERDEHLRRVGDPGAGTGIPDRRGLRHQLGRGCVDQLPERRSAEHPATLVGVQRGPVSDPEHLPGSNPRAGKILAGPDATDRVALLCRPRPSRPRVRNARSPER